MQHKFLFQADNNVSCPSSLNSENEKKTQEIRMTLLKVRTLLDLFAATSDLFQVQPPHLYFINKRKGAQLLNTH